MKKYRPARGFSVKRIRPVGGPKSKNEKARTTWQCQFPDGHQLTIVARKEGAEVAHFHKGKDASKSPEYTILQMGETSWVFVDAKGGVTKKKIIANGDPVLIVIKPFVFHFCKMLTDCVLLERRVTHFDPAAPDSYPVAEFQEILDAYQASLKKKATSKKQPA